MGYALWRRRRRPHYAHCTYKSAFYMIAICSLVSLPSIGNDCTDRQQRLARSEKVPT